MLPVLSRCFLYLRCTLVANQITIGIIKTNGLNNISVNFTDINESKIAAMANVIVILTMLVLAADKTASKREMSAERTDMRVPVCLSSKYDASILISDLAASILISCCEWYEVACQRKLLAPWKKARRAKHMKIIIPNPR